tara:strand:- start:7295 stop:8062 length:768 start_codon:yes stop_codon:yes gene_type:complete
MKIALCLYGLVGSDRGKSYDKKGGTDTVLKECFKSFKNHVIDKNNTDVFFHTWDQEFEEELVKNYKPKLYKTEPQKTFSNTVPGPQKRVQAHYSRWYSTKIVNNLKLQYENENNFKYDYVLLSRFDMVWTVDILFNKLNKNIFYIPGSTKGNVPWGWPNNVSGVKYEIDDLWFISNSKNMDDFCILYNLINQYIQKENCPVHTGISNHMLAFYHLKKLGLIPENTKRIFNGPDLPNISGYSDYQLYRTYLKKSKK